MEVAQNGKQEWNAHPRADLLSIGKYQCRLEDERISDREKKIYAGVLEGLRYLLETAMQEGLQS